MRATRHLQLVLLGGCIALCMAWGTSMIWAVGWSSPRLSLLLDSGVVMLFPSALYYKNGLAVWAAQGGYAALTLPAYSSEAGTTCGPPGPASAVAKGRVWLPLWSILLPLALGFLTLRRAPPPSTKSPPCAECNYDLTGNVSGICPECGTRLEPRKR
jgi:hypothetical protein